MVVGGVVDPVVASIAAGGTANIKPAGTTTEWVIHNIYVPDGATVKMYRSDGSSTVDLGTITGPVNCACYHITYTSYMVLQNNGATAINFTYDGIITTA